MEYVLAMSFNFLLSRHGGKGHWLAPIANQFKKGQVTRHHHGLGNAPTLYIIDWRVMGECLTMQCLRISCVLPLLQNEMVFTDDR